jgi:hypothetical protein
VISFFHWPIKIKKALVQPTKVIKLGQTRRQNCPLNKQARRKKMEAICNGLFVFVVNLYIRCHKQYGKTTRNAWICMYSCTTACVHYMWNILPLEIAPVAHYISMIVENRANGRQYTPQEFLNHPLLILHAQYRVSKSLNHLNYSTIYFLRRLLRQVVW